VLPTNSITLKHHTLSWYSITHNKNLIFVQYISHTRPPCSSSRGSARWGDVGCPNILKSIIHWIRCNILQHTAPHCNTLHHTAPHCTTLHHTATHCTTPPPITLQSTRNHIALLTAYNEWWLCRVSENYKYSILTPYYSAVNTQSYRAAHCLQPVSAFATCQRGILK